MAFSFVGNLLRRNTKSTLDSARQYADGINALASSAFERLSPTSSRLLGQAESQARFRDDDRIGTGHILLAFFAFKQQAATVALESLGITEELLLKQLPLGHNESQSASLSWTPRAYMIVGLAGSEALRAGSKLVEPEHILLGIIRESERWEAAGLNGPQYLGAAADAAGTTLSAIEMALNHSQTKANIKSWPARQRENPGGNLW